MRVRLTALAAGVGSSPRPRKARLPLGVAGGLLPSSARDSSKFSTEGLLARVSRFGRLPEGVRSHPPRRRVGFLLDRVADASWAPPAEAPFPSSEFAKCSSKAIDTWHREFPHFLLNKRIPEE